MVVRYLVLLIAIVLKSNLVEAKSIKIEGVEIDLEKNYRKNLQKFDTYFQKKYGSYEGFYKSSKVSEQDQKLLYYRNETIIKIMNEDEISEQERETTKKLFSKADEFDQDDLDFDSLASQFEKAQKANQSRQMKIGYYTNANFLTWEYRFKGTDRNDKDITIISQEAGSCFGGGLIYGNANFEWRVDACIAILEGIANDTGNTEYGPHKIDTKGAIVGVGMYWKPQADLFIGFVPSYFYHETDYPVVKGGVFHDRNKNALGYLVDLRWGLTESLDFNIKVGDATGYNPSILMFGAGYRWF